MEQSDERPDAAMLVVRPEYTVNDGNGKPTISSSQPRRAQGNASLMSGVSNLANTILGAGMLGLPHAFAMAGFVPGTLMLVVFAAFAAGGLHLLSEAANVSGRPASFYGVAEAAWPGAGLVIDLAIGIKCFGVATSYLIVVGDSMPLAMEAFGNAPDSLAANRHLWTAGAAMLVAPLTYCRRVDALKFTSGIALACVLFVVLLVFLFATRAAPIFESCNPSPPALPPMLPPLPPLSPPQPPSSPPLPPSAPPCRLPTVASAPVLEILRAIPVFVFSYTCHQNIISISNELAQPTVTRVGRVILASVNAGLGVYLLISVSGYLTFGPVVDSDVLKTYPHSPLVAVARIAISLVVTFSYPLQSHPSRGCVISLLGAAARRHDRWRRRREGLPPPPPPPPPSEAPPPSLTMHAAVTTAFLLASTAIALSVTDLGVVLSLVGATGSTIVSYILPGTTYFCLCREPRKRWRGAALVGVGAVIMPLSLTLIVLKEMHKLPG